MRAIIFKICGLFFLSSLAVSHVAAETWELIFPTKKRGEATHIQTLPSGDILVGGSASLTSPNLTGAWVARITADGYEVWSTEITGLAHSSVTELVLEPNRIILAGSHMVTNPFVFDTQGYIAALSYDGDILWETRLALPEKSIWLSQFQRLPSGEYILGGGASNHSKFFHAAYFALVDQTGAVKWSLAPKPLDAHDAVPEGKAWRGGPDGKEMIEERAGPIQVRPDGGFDLFIRRREFVGKGGPIVRCLAISAAGEMLQDKICNEDFEAIEQRTNPYAPFQFTRYGPNFFMPKGIEVSKRNARGDALWTWVYDTELQAGITDAVQTDDGGIIAIGYLFQPDAPKYHEADAIVFRLDKEGNEVWSHIYGSDRRDNFAAIHAAGQDEYYIIGHTGADAFRDWDPWVLRISGDGLAQSIVPRE